MTLTTPTFDPLGLWLSPLSSLINHSCTPNAVVVYAGATLALRSLAFIPTGTELSISYIDNTDPTSRRQSEVQNRYFFTCTCPSCKANSTEGLPDPAPDPAFETLSARAVELQNDAANKAPEEAASLLKTALSLFASHPPCRQPYPTILHTAFLNSIATQSWPRALSYAVRAYFHIDPVRYPSVWHPVRVVREWVLLRCIVQIAALVSERNASVEILGTFRIDWQVVAIGLAREVQGGVQWSHGLDNPFAGEVRAFVEGLGIKGRNVDGKVLEEVWQRLRKVANADFF